MWPWRGQAEKREREEAARRSVAPRGPSFCESKIKKGRNFNFALLTAAAEAADLRADGIVVEDSLDLKFNNFEIGEQQVLDINIAMGIAVATFVTWSRRRSVK